MSLVEKILKDGKPFILFHTYSVTKAVLARSIGERKSMDLDICVDDVGVPYLGHSREFYEKSGENQPKNLPFWEAVGLLAKSDIPVIVDCKHIDAWPVVEQVVAKLGAARCFVHAFVLELKFDYSRKPGESDYLTEWQPVEKLKMFKRKFPEVTACASCKWLPDDLPDGGYPDLLEKIRQTLQENSIDTVCLNIPNHNFNDGILRFFLKNNIICHVGIDGIDASKLKEIYIGETDNLGRASVNF
jgi:hypothetical protein